MKLPLFVKVLIVLGFLFLLFLFVRRYQLFWKEDKFSLIKRSIDLPKKDYVAGYIQEEILDFDGNGNMDEAAAIYHDAGTEDKIYNAFFAIFKKTGDDWEKIFERHLGTFNLWDDRQTPAEAGRVVNKIVINDFTDQGGKEILLIGKPEDTDSFLTVSVYNWKNNQVENIFQSEGLYQGKAGVEEDKLWTVIGILDKGAEYFPSYWVKQWWQCQGRDFVPVAYWQDENLENIEKMTFKDALQKNLQGLSDEQLKEVAVRFLSGENVKKVVSINTLNKNQQILFPPKTVSIREVSMYYDPSVDQYFISPIGNTNAGNEEKLVKEVFLEYETLPYQARVQIDPISKRVVDFSIGKR